MESYNQTITTSSIISLMSTANLIKAATDLKAFVASPAGKILSDEVRLHLLRTIVSVTSELVRRCPYDRDALVYLAK